MWSVWSVLLVNTYNACFVLSLNFQNWMNGLFYRDGTLLEAFFEILIIF